MKYLLAITEDYVQRAVFKLNNPAWNTNLLTPEDKTKLMAFIRNSNIRVKLVKMAKLEIEQDSRLNYLGYTFSVTNISKLNKQIQPKCGKIERKLNKKNFKKHRSNSTTR